MRCHAAAGAEWRESSHAHANREFAGSELAAAFRGQAASTFSAGYTFTAGPNGSVMREQRRDGPALEHRPAFVLGHSSLQQPVVESAPGKFQAGEVAWDPAKREWFDVFGGSERRPGEFGHWLGQGMNWNSNCAACHMTGFAKNYDAGADRFRSTWIEHGVGCVQCHGPLPGHENAPPPAANSPATLAATRARAMQTCASCHARAEELTSGFVPGEKFADHYRLQLVDGAAVYFPDGQIRDETFEWGSFQHSKMSAAGVTCLDCHNPHSGKLRAPADNNALCLQCHTSGNTRNAPVIDPTAHSHHGADSRGNRCVECHMAETTYMQRDPRRDHGFIIPDPALHREVGVPDACSRCHTDRTLDELTGAWERWYGHATKHAARRDRTRAMARAAKDDRTAVAELLRSLADERVPAWRASLLAQADRLGRGGDDVLAAASALRADPEAAVRATAIRALACTPITMPLVRAALEDPARLVRLEAAAALGPALPDMQAARREYAAFLDVAVERPAAKLRRGQDRFSRGDPAGGMDDVRAAMRLDPLAAALPEALGFMLNANGRSADAAGQFEKAASLTPARSEPTYFAGLAWAEAGDLAKAEFAFREAVKRAPRHSRAWYNLGLLLARGNHPADALEALATAEHCDPTDADIPWAAATIHLQAGRNAEALACAKRVLVISPRHTPARRLVDALQR